MQKQSQPQTTSKSNVRDASVQISAGSETHVFDLYLPVQAQNALAGQGIDTLGKLLALTRNEVMKLQNIGPVLRKRITYAMKDLGHVWPQGETDVSTSQAKTDRHTPKTKFEAILDGAKKKEEMRRPNKDNTEFWHHTSRINYGMAAELAMIIKNLTSTSKDDREYAKKKVRELIKLGREAGK